MREMNGELLRVVMAVCVLFASIVAGRSSQFHDQPPSNLATELYAVVSSSSAGNPPTSWGWDLGNAITTWPGVTTYASSGVPCTGYTINITAAVEASQRTSMPWRPNVVQVYRVHSTQSSVCALIINGLNVSVDFRGLPSSLRHLDLSRSASIDFGPAPLTPGMLDLRKLPTFIAFFDVSRSNLRAVVDMTQIAAALPGGSPSIYNFSNNMLHGAVDMLSLPLPGTPLIIYDLRGNFFKEVIVQAPLTWAVGTAPDLTAPQPVNIAVDDNVVVNGMQFPPFPIVTPLGIYCYEDPAAQNVVHMLNLFFTGGLAFLSALNATSGKQCTFQLGEQQTNPINGFIFESTVFGVGLAGCVPNDIAYARQTNTVATAIELVSWGVGANYTYGLCPTAVALKGDEWYVSFAPEPSTNDTSAAQAAAKSFSDYNNEDIRVLARGWNDGEYHDVIYPWPTFLGGPGNAQFFYNEDYMLSLLRPTLPKVDDLGHALKSNWSTMTRDVAVYPNTVVFGNADGQVATYHAFSYAPIPLGDYSFTSRLHTFHLELTSRSATLRVYPAGQRNDSSRLAQASCAVEGLWKYQTPSVWPPTANGGIQRAGHILQQFERCLSYATVELSGDQTAQQYIVSSIEYALFEEFLPNGIIIFNVSEVQGNVSLPTTSFEFFNNSAALTVAPGSYCADVELGRGYLNITIAENGTFTMKYFNATEPFNTLHTCYISDTWWYNTSNSVMLWRGAREGSNWANCLPDKTDSSKLTPPIVSGSFFPGEDDESKIVLVDVKGVELMLRTEHCLAKPSFLTEPPCDVPWEHADPVTEKRTSFGMFPYKSLVWNPIVPSSQLASSLPSGQGSFTPSEGALLSSIRGHLRGDDDDDAIAATFQWSNSFGPFGECIPLVGSPPASMLQGIVLSGPRERGVSLCYPENCQMTYGDCSETARMVATIVGCFLGRGFPLTQMQLPRLPPGWNSTAGNATTCMDGTSGERRLTNIIQFISEVTANPLSARVRYETISSGGGAVVRACLPGGNNTDADDPILVSTLLVESLATQGVELRATTCRPMTSTTAYPLAFQFMVFSSLISVMFVIFTNFADPCLRPLRVWFRLAMSSQAIILSNREKENHRAKLQKLVEPKVLTKSAMEEHVDHVTYVVDQELRRIKTLEAQGIIEVHGSDEKRSSRRMISSSYSVAANGEAVQSSNRFSVRSLNDDAMEDSETRANSLQSQTPEEQRGAALFRSLLQMTLQSSFRLAMEASDPRGMEKRELLPKLVALRRACNEVAILEMEAGSSNHISLDTKFGSGMAIDEETSPRLEEGRKKKQGSKLSATAPLLANNDSVFNWRTSTPSSGRRLSQQAKLLVKKPLKDVREVLKSTPLSFVLAEDWVANNFLVPKDWYILLQTVICATYFVVCIVDSFSSSVTRTRQLSDNDDDVPVHLRLSWLRYQDVYFRFLNSSMPGGLIVNVLYRRLALYRRYVTDVQDWKEFVVSILKDPLFIFSFSLVAPGILTHSIAGCGVFFLIAFAVIVPVTVLGIAAYKSPLIYNEDKRVPLNVRNVAIIALHLVVRASVTFASVFLMQGGFNYAYLHIYEGLPHFYSAQHPATGYIAKMARVATYDFQARSFDCSMDQLQHLLGSSLP